ncbi:MAG: SUMF1/EgtB/PvdO family nonheme iron enzyme, partial [Deltaproteobacteria bacterium]|nr:SUMF1/EgtB/PvdO family nonheme iron enzyme [Deltaproteobacteria bacterium]
LPLVMYNLLEAEAWCDARGKRLCYDDEWQTACEGSALSLYPYGDSHQPGVCNDEEVWRLYDQPSLNGWPTSASGSGVESLQDLFTAARSAGGSGAAEHVEWLYQGEGSGDNTGCVGEAGVFDLVGNVEEWTRRRDGGQTDFHGNLKGRYWSEVRTCQSNIKGHGDYFRFYEIGFRCCRDRAW